jgi:hypothetical protein
MGAAQDSPGLYMYLLHLYKETTASQKVAFSGLRNFGFLAYFPLTRSLLNMAHAL